MSLEEFNYVITDKRPSESWDYNEYKILHADSGGASFGKDSSTAQMVYLCEYNYIEKFIDTVLGKTVKSGSSLVRSAEGVPFGATAGSLPEEHPYFYNFFAASANVEPMGASSQEDIGPLWKKAKVTVAFRPPSYNVIADSVSLAGEYDRFTTKIPEGTAEFLTLQASLRFVTDPTHRLLESSPGQTIAGQRSTYTWHQIPTITRSDGYPDLGRVPNVSTIEPLLGKVNSVPFDNYEAGTVLFVTYSAKLVLPSTAFDNNYYWDISYVFGIRNYGVSSTPLVSGEHQGWNYVFDPILQAWDLVTTDGTTGGKPTYAYADLNTLFTVSW